MDENTLELIRGVLQPARWEKMQAVLDARLGALRLVVENIHNAHNMSAVVRTAEGLGLQHLHAVETDSDFAVSRRISRGAHKWLTLHRHRTVTECVGELRQRGFRLYAAMLSGNALPLEELPVDTPLAVVFGHEKNGISAETAAACDGAFTIPMPGFVQSFNVSVAAAVSLYSLSRRVRRERADGGLLSEAEKAEVLATWLPDSVHCGRRMVRAAQS